MQVNYQGRTGADSNPVLFRSDDNKSPLVSVILPTYNRPSYLAAALDSVVRQEYSNLQIIVVNDGGCDVKAIVETFSDARITFINRRQNRGKAFSLNEALACAKGKYIAYLDDDDVFYPEHIDTLVVALEENRDCGVAYSDLYKVYCRTAPDGSRIALSKVVDVSRDFDRFVMLYFNHVLHVSCLHRRDLLDRTGPYNENLNVLIDWDMTRRLAFFSDFCHIHRITGEYYQPEGDTNRISYKRRQNKEDYARNLLTIRTTRPAKPWNKMADVSIILLLDKFDRQAGETIGLIWRYTFYPYKLHLPMPTSQLNTDMPNIVNTYVEPVLTQLQQLDRTLADCEGQYVVVVPAGFPVRDMWLEDSLYALLNTQNTNEAFELEGSTPDCNAVVARMEHLRFSRGKYPRLPVRDGLLAAGIGVRRLLPDEIPFKFDSLLQKTRDLEKSKKWNQAAESYEYISENYGNKLWMKSLAAENYYRAGNFTKAAEIIALVNQQRPTADTLLLEAKIKRRNKDFNTALALLTSAREILAGNVLSGLKTPAGSSV